jgi:anthranilate phosphoribosyltransferase
VCEVRGGSVTCYDLSPEVLGLAEAPPDLLRAGSARESADAVQAVLSGEAGPRRDVVLANAGAALYVSGVACDIHDGLQRAAAGIDSGAAARVLASLVAISHENT